MPSPTGILSPPTRRARLPFDDFSFDRSAWSETVKNHLVFLVIGMKGNENIILERIGPADPGVFLCRCGISLSARAPVNITTEFCTRPAAEAKHI